MDGERDTDGVGVTDGTMDGDGDVDGLGVVDGIMEGDGDGDGAGLCGIYGDERIFGVMLGLTVLKPPDLTTDGVLRYPASVEAPKDPDAPFNPDRADGLGDTSFGVLTIFARPPGVFPYSICDMAFA
jgi:hypothetical protein